MRWLLLTVLCLSMQAQAQERRTYDGYEIVERPHTVYADSSKALREGRSWHYSVGAGLLALQGTVGAFLNPDTSLDLQLSYQQDFLIGVSRTVSLSLRRFLADALYLRGGLGGRWGDSINYINSFGGDPGAVPGYDFGFEGGVGHEWQWERVNFAVEWFSAYMPLLSKDHKIDLQFRIITLSVGASL